MSTDRQTMPRFLLPRLLTRWQLTEIIVTRGTCRTKRVFARRVFQGTIALLSRVVYALLDFFKSVGKT